MNPNQLNQETEQRKQNCRDKTITVDTFNGIAKGYCKAKDLQNHSPESLLNHPTQNDKDMSLCNSKLSGHTLFNELGVDYSG